MSQAVAAQSAVGEAAKVPEAQSSQLPTLVLFAPESLLLPLAWLPHAVCAVDGAHE